jgi:hypothetical protein
MTMVGSGLGGFEERVPCEHCGDTDCTGLSHQRYIRPKDGRPGYWSARRICIHTGKQMTFDGMLRSALQHGLKMRKAIEDQSNLIGLPIDRLTMNTWDWTGAHPVVKRRGGITITDVVSEAEARENYVLDNTPRIYADFKVYRPRTRADRHP